VGEGHTGEPRANHERLTVAQAAAALDITEGAVRSRIKRGTLPTTKEGGTVFVLLGDGTSQANQPPKTGVPGDQSALIEALRDQIEDLRGERDEWREQARITDRLLSAAMDRIPAIEASQEASESPETAEETPDRAEPRSTTQSAEEATERRRAPPVDKLPLWQWVLGGALSLLAFPATELLSILIGAGAINLPYWLALAVVFLPVLLPGVFGYWVGLRLRDLSFWRHVAPMGGLLIAGVFIGSWLLWRYIAWITGWLFGFGTAGDSIGVALARDPSLLSLLLVISPAALYSFAALLGNARQRRKREKLYGGGPSESRWSPRQEAMVGLAGSIIAALIGLLGNLLST
jgi:hypothetical protein